MMQIKYANNIGKDLTVIMRTSLLSISSNVKSLSDTLIMVDNLQYELDRKSLLQIKTELNQMKNSLENIQNRIEEQTK